MNIYKEAVKQNITFTCGRGVLSLPNLFNLAVVDSGSRVSLDSIYAGLMEEKEGMNTRSYVGTTDNAKLATVELKLAILKDIMDDKLAAADAAKTAAAKAKRRQALLAEQAKRIADAPAKLSDAELAEALAETE
jgi:hypothetical protein